VLRVAESRLPTRHGEFRAIAYRDLLTGHEHLALIAGTPPSTGALVRVHSECLTGDAFGSGRCDCGPQLDAALDRIATEGGAVVYLRGHEGRGIGLLAKLTAYQLQDSGLDTVAANTAQGLPADAREYGAAAAMLDDLGLDEIRLLTNNPAKLTGLAEHGLGVSERIALQVGLTADNQRYLATKRDLMGHQLDDLGPARTAAGDSFPPLPEPTVPPADVTRADVTRADVTRVDVTSSDVSRGEVIEGGRR